MTVKKYKENGKISIKSPIWNPEEVEEAEKELLEILKISYNFEEKGYTVLVDKEASLKEALESEKEELLAKLAEIEESLKGGK